MRTIDFKVKAEADFAMTKRELYKKLKDWLEHNSHTTSSFGFTLKELDFWKEDE